MLLENTDFISNAIGIDPDGCGCTDCLVGNSIPENASEIDELIQAYFEEGRDVINRTNGHLILYQNLHGAYTSESVYADDIELLEAVDVWAYDGDENEVVLHAEYCACYDCEHQNTIPLTDEESFNEAMRKHYDEGEHIYNKTDAPLVISKSWDGSYQYLTVHTNASNPKVAIVER